MPKPDMRAILKKLVDRGEQVFTNKANEGILGEYEGVVETLGDLECEKADVVVCMRVADIRIWAPNSVKSECASCREPIWVAPSSPMTPPKVCMNCVGEYTEEELFKRIKRKDA